MKSVQSFHELKSKTEGVLGLQNVHREHKCAEDSLNFFIYDTYFLLLWTLVYEPHSLENIQKTRERHIYPSVYSLQLKHLISASCEN